MRVIYRSPRLQSYQKQRDARNCGGVLGGGFSNSLLEGLKLPTFACDLKASKREFVIYQPPSFIELTEHLMINVEYALSKTIRDDVDMTHVLKT